MMNSRTIYFDMDGTIADFYGVENWLEYLLCENPYPYAEAKPLLNFSHLARLLNSVQRQGYKIGIISWLSRSGGEEFMEKVTATKIEWLHAHLPSVNFDEIHICKYGYPKENFCNDNDILFDDELPNRENWNGEAFEPNEIITVLKKMMMW